MHSLVNTTFNRTYNPNGRQNALSDIKRLLTSRDTAAQRRACENLIEVISRYSNKSDVQMIEHLMDNDITVFLCNAICNLDFTLFRLIMEALRLLWRSERFFLEQHAAHSMAAVVRALTNYAGSGTDGAVDACLQFLCDLINQINTHKTTPPISHQSAYSAAQLLACLKSLAPQIETNQKTILSSALVLDALLSYQPDNVTVEGGTVAVLVEVLNKWFGLLMAAVNHAMLAGDGDTGKFYVVLCQLGINSLRVNFVKATLSEEEHITILKQCAVELATSVQRVVTDLVMFTKEHEEQIGTEEYGVFLKLLLKFFSDASSAAVLPDFCDMLCSRGYLEMLSQVHIMRKDKSIRKTSTLLLGELLKVLASKYLNVDDVQSQSTCANVIHMGLVELQYAIEEPQSIGSQLQKGQPYSILIYIYFYCQYSDRPKEATSSLLPFLAEHILKLKENFPPPPYIIKALWLVFAMSSISNDSIKSLEEIVHLEKATQRLVGMLHPVPAVYYTHHPATLLWAFTSQSISYYVRCHVVFQWLNFEDNIPIELTVEPALWDILFKILIHSENKTVLKNCLHTVHGCLEEVSDEISHKLSLEVWHMLPDVLSKCLIDSDTRMGPNMSHFLELATTLLPVNLEQTICQKTAVLITAVFTKCDPEEANENRSHFKYVCLKLSLYLLGIATNQNDNGVLLMYINHPAFLPGVLSAINSVDDRVARAALQLLSYVVHYFTRNNYEPKSILQIQTRVVIQSLRRDSHSERGASLLELVYMVLNSGVNTPLALAYDIEDTTASEQQCNALRALMFRIQLMLCSGDSEGRSSAGWRTLGSMFKHAVIYKNDSKLVAILTSQMWTHTLVQFQMEHAITPEFLSFLLNWLTLLKITVKRTQEKKRMSFCMHSVIIKSMVFLKKNLKVEGDLKATANQVLRVVRNLLQDFGLHIL